MKRIIAGLGLALLSVSSVFSQEPAADRKSQDKPSWQVAAEKQVEPLLEKKKLSALVVGVIDPTGKKQFLVLGEKPGSLTKLDENTIFEIGSITKTMTSMLLADGIQRIELKLDDPVQMYLPEGMVMPKKGNKDITLEDLATHTSGFPRLPPGLGSSIMANPKLQENPYSQYDSAQLRKSLSETKPKVSDKPKVDYSNYGAGLLGFALTQKYKKPYGDLLQERLLGPLAMKSTSTVVADSDKARFIDGFKENGQAAQHWDFQDTLGPAGSVRSTAADMLLYLESAMGRNKTLQFAFDLALAPQYEMSPRVQIGLAWLIIELEKKRVWWHNGGTGGFSSFAGFSKDPAVGVVVLSNRFATSQVDSLGMKVLQELIKSAAENKKK